MLLVSLISGDTCAYAVSPHTAYGSVQSVVSHGVEVRATRRLASLAMTTPFVFLHAKEISRKNIGGEPAVFSWCEPPLLALGLQRFRHRKLR